MRQSIAVLILGFILLALYSCYTEQFTTTEAISVKKIMNDKTHPASLKDDFNQVLKYFADKYAITHPAQEIPEQETPAQEIPVQEYKTQSEINSEIIKHQQDINNLVLPKLSNDMTYVQDINPEEILSRIQVSTHPRMMHETAQNNYPDLVLPLNQREYNTFYYSPRF
jgi:hypothetical protein